jgi:cupin fold WbuC family metalloprotein
MQMIQKSPEVFLVNGPIVEIGEADIEILRNAAKISPKRRARVNAHPDSQDLLHEMVIAIDRESYIRPHKHPVKCESFHIVEGAVDIIVFDDVGEIIHIVPLAERGMPGSFYYRMSKPFFHTLIIKTDLLVTHEITNGPFTADGTVFADFAPAEDDAPAVANYMDNLRERAAKFPRAK